MRRIVLDTSVVVSAFRSKREASYAILDLVAERRLVPLATPPLFLQYEEVLKRPDQLAASGLTLDAVDGILNALASAVEGVTVYYAWRPRLRFGGAPFWRTDCPPVGNPAEDQVMSKGTYPLKLPSSIKAAAARLAR